MRGYGQYCPVAKASEVLAERWTPLVLRELILRKSQTFNEIHNGVPLMSRTLLSKRLRELERVGIVERQTGKRAEYQVTQAGRELAPIIEQLGVWGQRWVRSSFGADDLDPRLLMWEFRRGIDTDRLPEHRVVVEFAFTDVPRAQLRHIWLVLDRPDVDVCFKDPGFGTDLLVTTKLRTLTRAWMGDTSLREALQSEQIRIDGTRKLAAAFPGWLPVSRFAGIKPAAAS